MEEVSHGDKVKVLKASKRYAGQTGLVCDVRAASDAISVRFGNRDDGDRVLLFPGEYEVVERVRRAVNPTNGGNMAKKTGWRAKLAEVAEPEDDEQEESAEEEELISEVKETQEKGYKILDESDSLDDFVIVSGSQDGKHFKRITYQPTTAREARAKLKSAHGYPIYKLEKDAKAESASRKAEERGETTMKTTKGKVSKAKATKAVKGQAKTSKNGGSREQGKRVDDDVIAAFIKSELKKDKAKYVVDGEVKVQRLVNAFRATGRATSFGRFEKLCKKA